MEDVEERPVPVIVMILEPVVGPEEGVRDMIDDWGK